MTFSQKSFWYSKDNCRYLVLLECTTHFEMMVTIKFIQSQAYDLVWQAEACKMISPSLSCKRILSHSKPTNGQHLNVLCRLGNLRRFFFLFFSNKDEHHYPPYAVNLNHFHHHHWNQAIIIKSQMFKILVDSESISFKVYFYMD